MLGRTRYYTRVGFSGQGDNGTWKSKTEILD